jgi:hypothetical protein
MFSVWPPKRLVIPDPPSAPKFEVMPPVDAVGKKAVLDALHNYVENLAVHHWTWYMNHRRRRLVASFNIRMFSLIFLFAGGLCPLLSKSWPSSPIDFDSWGYVLIAVGGGLLLFDRLFGLSSSWMRDIAAALQIDALRGGFRMQWISIQSEPEPGEPKADGNKTPSKFGRLLALVEQTVGGIHNIVLQETRSWNTEFQSNITQMTSMAKREQA